MAFSRTYSGRAPSHKVVLLGESGVGKTSLLKRLDNNTFDEYQTATIGIEKCTTVMRVENEPVMVSTMHTCTLRMMALVSIASYLV